MKHILIAIIALLGFISCDKEAPTPAQSTIEQSIPIAVQPYVDKLVEQGRQRGYDIPTDNLIVELTGAVQSGNDFVCASTWGTVISQEQNLIRIDTQCVSWRYGGLEREILVIHELGHALLERFHREGRFPSGDWVSLMSSDWNIGDFYALDPDKESYYFDELFDESTPVPDWAE